MARGRWLRSRDRGARGSCEAVSDCPPSAATAYYTRLHRSAARSRAFADQAGLTEHRLISLRLSMCVRVTASAAGSHVTRLRFLEHCCNDGPCKAAAAAQYILRLPTARQRILPLTYSQANSNLQSATVRPT
eukprot:1201150-Pleurochrysis_carterae.AAC.1